MSTKSKEKPKEEPKPEKEEMAKKKTTPKQQAPTLWDQPKEKEKKKQKRLSRSERQALKIRVKNMVDKLEKKEGIMEKKELLAYALRINSHRDPASFFIDNSQDNRKRLALNKENVIKWARHPGRYDLIGVDNFEKNNPTIGLKKRAKQAKVMNLYNL